MWEIELQDRSCGLVGLAVGIPEVQLVPLPRSPEVWVVVLYPHLKGQRTYANDSPDHGSYVVHERVSSRCTQGLPQLETSPGS